MFSLQEVKSTEPTSVKMSPKVAILGNMTFSPKSTLGAKKPEGNNSVQNQYKRVEVSYFPLN
jgi:hypothetical protein